MDDLDFTGKHVLVVGGSSGIGNGVAHGFVERGAKVHVWGTRASAADYRDEAGSNLDGLGYSCVNVGDAAAGDVLDADQQAEINQLAETLKQEYSSTQYAYYAALVKAKLAVEGADLSAATVELEWAMDNAEETLSENIARLRLARVQAAAGNLDTALQLVQGVDAGELKSAFDEAKGDFYQQQGNSGAAYSAYEAAMMGIDVGNSSASQLLQLKISQVKPVITQAVEVEDSVEAEGSFEAAGSVEQDDAS